MRLPPKPPRCELWMLAGGMKHGRDLQLHHVIARGWTQGNLKARRYVDEHEELLAWVCPKCNAGSKIADTKMARRHLLLKHRQHYGEARMREVVDGVPWRVARPEASWEAMTS